MIPYLYTVVEQKKLQEMCTAFHCCTHLPIRILDEQGHLLEPECPDCNYCKRFKKYAHPEDACDTVHLEACRYATSLGETYIFSCPANLNHIVFPLMNRDTLFGSILVGPFLLDTPDAIMLSDLSRRYPEIPTGPLLELYEEAQDIPVITPHTAGQVSKLLYYLFSNLMSESRQLLIEKQERLSQQSKINESIQMYKTQLLDTTSSYPMEKERDLITKVRNGNIAEAKGILNDLLGYVLFVDGGKLETIKSRAVELCTLLSRASIEGGGASDPALRQNAQFIKKISQCTSYEALCYILQEIVEIFADNILSHGNIKNREIMKKAVSFISQHYSEPITLSYVANEVHLNPAYFSTLFKKEIGLSFKEYLNHVRIEESKRLLSNSNFSIIDIAIAVGFEDQSYFSKVFKKYTGMTPKQFR
ncbi:MAG TPA: PocR ligand-binding domain-containing protein [Candidatus Scybalocola faecavium]|nr:PocR ligand-binding domain-containing protein [Candidatus Scybalocola faecavium]